MGTKKKQYAEKGHIHWGMIITFILFAACVITVDTLLENRINSKPDWECHNESFEGFINRNETGLCISTDSFHYPNGQPRNWICDYEGYEAKCKYENCYVNDIKEVCVIA